VDTAHHVGSDLSAKEQDAAVKAFKIPVIQNKYVICIPHIQFSKAHIYGK